MIAEVLDEVYDAKGRSVFRPHKKSFAHFAPNAPMGRYITQPLTVTCRDLEDVRRFLMSCQLRTRQSAVWT
jgi:hypothetical protein